MRDGFSVRRWVAGVLRAGRALLPWELVACQPGSDMIRPLATQRMSAILGSPTVHHIRSGLCQPGARSGGHKLWGRFDKMTKRERYLAALHNQPVDE